MTPEERRTAIDAIGAEVSTCTRCRLHQSRTRAVPGEGHLETEVVFVGEGPGFNEDQQGRPFVGAAGGLLTELLGSVGWRRDEVFITNVVKCRPPGNRDPEPDEVAACRPYLERQLQVLDPALVVTLGRHSMNAFLPGARISAAHGTLRPVDPATGAEDAFVYAMYHPAVAFRQPALRDTLKADMAGVPEALLRSREERAARRRPAEADGPTDSVAVEASGGVTSPGDLAATPATAPGASSVEPAMLARVPQVDGASPESDIRRDLLVDAAPSAPPADAGERSLSAVRSAAVVPHGAVAADPSATGTANTDPRLHAPAADQLPLF